MANTKISEVIKSFHSSFVDKKELPDSLENEWVQRAIGEYGIKIEPLNYDEISGEFDCQLTRDTIDVLALMMKVYYSQREYSRVNKIASIVGKELSVNANMSLSKYAEDELTKASNLLVDKLNDLKPSAYN